MARAEASQPKLLGEAPGADAQAFTFFLVSKQLFDTPTEHLHVSVGNEKSGLAHPRTESRSPGTSLAIVGVPQAAASTFEMPQPSLADVRRWIQLFRRRSLFSTSVMKPRKSTCSVTPSDSRSASSLG